MNLRATKLPNYITFGMTIPALTWTSCLTNGGECQSSVCGGLGDCHDDFVTASFSVSGRMNLADTNMVNQDNPAYEDECNYGVLPLGSIECEPAVDPTYSIGSFVVTGAPMNSPSSSCDCLEGTTTMGVWGYAIVRATGTPQLFSCTLYLTIGIHNWCSYSSSLCAASSYVPRSTFVQTFNFTTSSTDSPCNSPSYSGTLSTADDLNFEGSTTEPLAFSYMHTKVVRSVCLGSGTNYIYNGWRSIWDEDADPPVTMDFTFS